MANDRQFDSLEFQQLDFPYNTIQRELAENPRLVSGSLNSYITTGGKLVKRYGTVQMDSNINTGIVGRIDRLWIVETLDTPVIIYLVASVFIGGVWAPYYIRLDAGGSPVWTAFGNNLRQINNSTRPHEAVVSRGLLYIKGYPTAISGETLGTVIFDGTGGTPFVRPWGLLGPQVAARISAGIPRLALGSGNISAAATSITLTAQNNTNLLQYSQQFTQSVWTTSGGNVSVSDNTSTAPDGTMTGGLVTTTAVSQFYFQPFTTVASTQYEISIWVKNTGSTGLTLELQDGGGGVITSTVIAASGLWVRYALQGIATSTTTRLTFIIPNTGSFSLWGAQAEAAIVPGVTYPTTYVRTLGPYNLPATPFNAQIDYELVTVTAFAGGVATVLRGAQGTTPAAHLAGAPFIYRDWSASAHQGVVNLYWEYSYAYESITGQVSNRAPLESNPDANPSLTGPFFNEIPQVNIQGQADTVNIPFIRIYRTTDGGGTLMQVGRIANTGANPIAFFDNQLTSAIGGTNADPIPDAQLNSQLVAPSLTSNGPPTTVLAPLVTGVATPVAATTPIASYAGRLWFAIGNVVFFSANEELNVGVPEESFPSGTFGNFYRFQNPVTGLISTNTALYIITTQRTYMMTGTTLETFNPQPILSQIGGVIGHPMAYTTYGNAAIWLTNDLRVALLEGNQFKTISDPLGLDLVNAINAGALIDIHYWAEMEKEFIVVTAINQATPTASRVWVYDINKSTQMEQDFWNAPWTIQASAVASGRVRESQQQRRLTFSTWNGTTSFLTRWTTSANDAVGYDDIPSALQFPYDFIYRSNLFQVPPGDHVNMLRRPGLTPILWGFIAERTQFASEPDPTAVIFLNDLWTKPVPVSKSTQYARDDDPLGYRAMIFHIGTKASRVALQLSKIASRDLFELQNLALVYSSDSGAGKL